MLALRRHRFEAEETPIDVEELVRHGITGIMRQEDAVALGFDGVAARHDVDQQPPVRDAVERRRHAGRHRGLLQARPHRHEISKPLRQRHHGGSDDPGVLAGLPGRQQDAEIAEFVRRPGDLAEVAQRHVPCPGLAREVTPVAMGGQEPQDVGVRGGIWQVEVFADGHEISPYFEVKGAGWTSGSGLPNNVGDVELLRDELQGEEAVGDGLLARHDFRGQWRKSIALTTECRRDDGFG